MNYYFRHIYGKSYFGSGAAYGGVEIANNCRPVGRQDNGFVAGPAGVEVIDPTRPAHVLAIGGDAVGGGREWREEAWYTPASGWRRCFCSAGEYDTTSCTELQRDMRALRARLAELHAEAEARGDDYLARVYADIDAAIAQAAEAGDAPRLRYALTRARMCRV
jgi:hypothetical protein